MPPLCLVVCHADEDLPLCVTSFTHHIMSGGSGGGGGGGDGVSDVDDDDDGTLTLDMGGSSVSL